MAKVVLSTEFESISGRLCRRNGAVIAVNKKTGKMYRYDYHKPNQPNSQKQQDVKDLFTQKSKVAAAWYRINKPADKNATPTADFTRLKKAYDAQNEYGNIYAFLRSCVTDEMKIVIAGVEVTNFVPDTEGLG